MAKLNDLHPGTVIRFGPQKRLIGVVSVETTAGFRKIIHDEESCHWLAAELEEFEIVTLAWSPAIARILIMMALCMEALKRHRT